MLKPSDFNNAVPQFSNGNYASNPINPQYVEEPSSTDYNRGTEPLQTLPAQWWNWFINKFTSRFNKVNIYVKNLFNELAQLLSLVNVTPDGTEGAVTDGQLKNAFEELYPDYINTKLALESTYVKKTQKVNNHALSGDVTVTKSDVGLGDVPNVSTNDQTPTYTEASSLTALSSGEKLSIAFGKLAKAVSSLISHIANVSNPHSVTKAQVGLGNVENTGDSATPVANGTTKFTTGGAWDNTYPRSYFNVSGQVTYITYDALYSDFSVTTNTYLISLRNGEAGILICGTTDNVGYIKPTYIKLTDGTNKISNVYWNQSTGKITFAVGVYTYISVTQIGGIKRTSLTYTTSTTYPTGVETINPLKTAFTAITDQILLSLAPSFSTATSYAVGDFVMYDSRLYICTTAHSAGAWNASHFTANSLSSLVKSDLMQWNKANTFNISNANNLTKAGCYTGYNLTNAPDMDGWYNYLVMTCDKNSQYVTQLALGATGNKCYTRSCIGGAWGSWELSATLTDINNPSVYYFSNPVVTNKTIHLGSFSATAFEQYSINITIEGTRTDGSSKLEASVSNARLYIGMTSGSVGNISLRMFKTDSTHADLYLDITSYMNSIYVKYTNWNHYTHDGSEVNSYTGTEVLPTYTLSSVAPTFNTSTSYTVGDMVTYNSILYTCTTAHSAGAWNASHFTVANLNTEFQKPADNIAVNFTTGKRYSKGELVIYNKELYRCKNNTFTSVDAWDSSLFEKTGLLNNEQKYPGLYTLNVGANVSTVVEFPELPAGSELIIRMDNQSSSNRTVTLKATKKYVLGILGGLTASVRTLQINETYAQEVASGGYLEVHINYIEVDDSTGFLNDSLLAFPLPTVNNYYS